MRGDADESALLDAALAEFTRAVYLAGLWDRIRESTYKGMSGRVGGTHLRSFCMAGRIRLTLECEGGCLNLYGAEEAPEKPDSYPYPIVRSSADASWETQRAMLAIVCAHWPATVAEQRRVFHDDPRVKPDVLAAEQARVRREEWWS